MFMSHVRSFKIIINPEKLAWLLQIAVLTLMNRRNYDYSDLSLQDLILYNKICLLLVSWRY